MPETEITEINVFLKKKVRRKKEKKKKKSKLSLYPNGFKRVQTADNCQRTKGRKERKKIHHSKKQ